MKKPSIRNIWHVITTMSIFCLCFALLIGCGTEDGDKPTSPVDEPVVVQTEPDVEVTDLYDGDNIIFAMGGVVYEGRVVKGVSEDEVLVRLTDGSEEVISVNSIDGTLIADHPDLETRVKLLGDQDQGESTLDGEIIAVYNSGVRKIKVTTVNLLDGRFKILDVPRIRFVHEDADFFDEGGYLTLDEFADLIFNGGG